jgi:uncharacterized coiled-coil protein SlyX
MMQSIELIADRLVRLESDMMQLEHGFEQMHQALVLQQREIDTLRRALERFEAVWERQESASPEVRDPAEEKPPHY